MLQAFYFLFVLYTQRGEQIIYIFLLLLQSAHLGKKWTYAVEWIPGVSARKSIVVVTSRPRSRDANQLLTVRAWTDRDATAAAAAEGESEEPVRVFAQVLKGRRPVVRARVRAEVQVETENGTLITILPLHLLDNGDGGVYNVYNAYLTKSSDFCPSRYKN
jgi:hypothetical protein